MLFILNTRSFAALRMTDNYKILSFYVCTPLFNRQNSQILRRPQDDCLLLLLSSRGLRGTLYFQLGIQWTHYLQSLQPDQLHSMIRNAKTPFPRKHPNIFLPPQIPHTPLSTQSQLRPIQHIIDRLLIAPAKPGSRCFPVISRVKEPKHV